MGLIKGLSIFTAGYLMGCSKINGTEFIKFNKTESKVEIIGQIEIIKREDFGFDIKWIK